MQITIKEKDLTISKELPDNCSCTDVLLATYDIVGRIFSQKSVIESHQRIDPDTMDAKR